MQEPSPPTAARPSRAVRGLVVLGLSLLAVVGTAPLASSGPHAPPAPVEQVAVAPR